MMKFSCKDMGMNCGFMASGKDKEEVMDKVMEHAKMEHADMLNKMSEKEKQDMMKKVESKIT